jgi:hypothetical protein
MPRRLHYNVGRVGGLKNGQTRMSSQIKGGQNEDQSERMKIAHDQVEQKRKKNDEDDEARSREDV